MYNWKNARNYRRFRDENGNVIDDSKIEHHELKTKEDIKNYIKGML